MTREDVDGWLAYSDRCNALLAETVKGAPEAFEATFETVSDFKSARQILAHLIGAEERWIKLRIGGQEIPVMYEQRAATTVDGIFADAAEIRSQTRAFLAPLTSADLLRPVEISIPRYDFRQTFTLSEIFFHMMTHEMYHRGQITTALQRQGIDTPNFDYVFLRE